MSYPSSNLQRQSLPLQRPSSCCEALFTFDCSVVSVGRGLLQLTPFLYRALDIARIVVLLVIYLSWRRCAYSWTSCAITRCREIMTPQLSIVKTRFAKASLRPRCARHRSWGATCRLPNGCVGHSASPIEEQGHSATQRLHWSSSFQRNVTGRQAEVYSGWASKSRQSGRCFVSFIGGPTHHTQTGGDLHQLSQSSTWRSIHRQRPPVLPRLHVIGIRLPTMRPFPGHRFPQSNTAGNQAQLVQLPFSWCSTLFPWPVQLEHPTDRWRSCKPLAFVYSTRHPSRSGPSSSVFRGPKHRPSLTTSVTSPTASRCVHPSS